MAAGPSAHVAASTVTIDGRTGATPGYDRAVPRGGSVQIVLAFDHHRRLLLDALWPLWDRQNQTLHDKAAGTVVLRTDSYR